MSLTLSPLRFAGGSTPPECKSKGHDDEETDDTPENPIDAVWQRAMGRGLRARELEGDEVVIRFDRGEADEPAVSCDPDIEDDHGERFRSTRGDLLDLSRFLIGGRQAEADATEPDANDADNWGFEVDWSSFGTPSDETKPDEPGEKDVTD